MWLWDILGHMLFLETSVFGEDPPAGHMWSSAAGTMCLGLVPGVPVGLGALSGSRRHPEPRTAAELRV